ncbi:MAG: guanylate kinase [Armatimonadota bacterium]
MTDHTMKTIPPADPSLQTRGILFILAGPSGVGKDTVLHRAMRRLGRIRPSISVTTRAPRPRERHGVDYFFVTPDEFEQLRVNDGLLEYAAVHAHHYGTPRAWVLEQLRAGTDVVLEIDVQGAEQVKKLFPDVVRIFMAPPSWGALAERLRGRLEQDRKIASEKGGKPAEDEATIQLRLRNARMELARAREFEYLIINDELNMAIRQFVAIVTAERCRPGRQDLRLLLEEEA